MIEPIEDTYGERPIKLSAGELILYPSTSFHWVDPVTSGVRLAAVGAQLRARTGAPRDPVRSGDGASGRYMPNKVSRAYSIRWSKNARISYDCGLRTELASLPARDSTAAMSFQHRAGLPLQQVDAAGRAHDSPGDIHRNSCGS